MAEGHVVITANDWGKISVALEAIPKMQADVAEMKKQLETPVAKACEECPELKQKVKTMWDERTKLIGWAAGAAAGVGGGVSGLIGWLMQ